MALLELEELVVCGGRPKGFELEAVDEAVVEGEGAIVAAIRGIAWTTDDGVVLVGSEEVVVGDADEITGDTV